MGKASIDFLVSLIRRMPDKFHVIISFRIDESSWDKIDEALYGYINKNIDQAKILRIEGLSTEEIGEWIKSARGVELPMVPDLERIRENSSGFPMLLNEWIKQSQNLDYDKIERRKLCHYINQRKKTLGNDKDSIKMLNRMAILIERPKSEVLARYLDTDDDNLQSVLEVLDERGIFEKKDNSYLWFRHKLIQKCIEDSIDEEIKQKFHQLATNLYAVDLDNNIDYSNPSITKNVIAYAYHLHESGMHEKSLIVNKLVADKASNIGDLDIAERCYQRAIDDAIQLHNIKYMMYCYLDLLHGVYIVWGRYDEAYEICKGILPEIKDFPGSTDLKARVLSYKAQLHYIKKQYDEALECYTTSLSILKGLDEKAQLGNQIRVAEVLHGMGMVFYDKEDYLAALGYFQKSKETFENSGNNVGIVSCSYHIANIKRINGDHTGALALLKRVLPIAEKTKNKSILAEVLHGLALLYYDKEGYEDEALKLLQQRQQIEENLGNKSGIAFTLALIGKIYIKKQMYIEALPYTSQAYDILERIGLPDAEVVLKDKRTIEEALQNSFFKNKSV